MGGKLFNFGYHGRLEREKEGTGGVQMKTIDGGMGRWRGEGVGGGVDVELVLTFECND